jgi:nicotinamide-nucleotide amidase
MRDERILKNVSDQLRKNNLTVATAESCTGGLLAHLLTNISGSSEHFERGVITYSNKSKMELLGIPQETIKEYGAVSKQTAKAMAIEIKEQANVDIGISTTGIAGPTGGTKEKPVGLVYIGIATSKKTEVKRFLFSKDRLQNKEKTCYKALEFLLETITKW